mmetsp:Transcript_345/g.1045  ORF Transcript_345/g.1045 Transcript_345/m.1045 type:complete len:385 (-) Transcript_345:322-1476(-)
MFLIMITGILAGTVAFFALPPHMYYGDDALAGSLDDPWEMSFFVFSIMMSAYEVSYFTAAISQAFTLIFVVIQSVLLLNALIALMSDTTEKIKGNIKVIALRERASILLEMELIIGKRILSERKYRPRWLHALVSNNDIAVQPIAGNNMHGPSELVKSGPSEMLGKQELAISNESLSRMMDIKLKQALDKQLDRFARLLRRENSSALSSLTSIHQEASMSNLASFPVAQRSDNLVELNTAFSRRQTLESDAKLHSPPTDQQLVTRRRWSSIRAARLLSRKPTPPPVKEEPCSAGPASPFRAQGCAVSGGNASAPQPEAGQPPPAVAAPARDFDTVDEGPKMQTPAPVSSYPVDSYRSYTGGNSPEATSGLQLGRRMSSRVRHKK